MKVGSSKLSGGSSKPRGSPTKVSKPKPRAPRSRAVEDGTGRGKGKVRVSKGKKGHKKEKPPTPAGDGLAETVTAVTLDRADDNPPKMVASGSPPSAEDDDRFMIKSRTPPMNSTGASSGHVRQVVVAAFEAGMIINEGKNKPENEEGETKLKLNEYGSNLGGATGANRKRPLEDVGGDIDDVPSPKKKFIEEEQDPEQVEEASLEWPQPVK
ncbi:unnamed protein product [Linum trigynum]|uniref:Uncharacterized protein n=1 Tax=Linum trigynum TaxID=586398 RepID=A0AAV2EPN2_9ROSI